MKKAVSLILTVAVLLSACTVFTAASASKIKEGNTYYVYTDNGKTLNLREGPSISSKVILKIPFGDPFVVFETTGTGWAYGHWGGAFGYVMTRFLSAKKPSAKPTPKPTTKPTPEEEAQKAEQAKLNNELKSEKEVEPFYIAVRAARTTSWVNFRVGPSKITSRIGTLPDGKEMIVVGETTNWYRVRDPETNKLGYIHKNYTTILPQKLNAAEEKNDGTQRLGTLNVNGAFDLTCKLPEGYELQVVNMKGSSIVASVLSKDLSKPQLYLSIAYDESYGDVERMNDMTDAELAVLEEGFKDMNQVEITYRQTGLGTKLLIARETGADTDFVDILAIYKGYFIEFNMTPSPSAASQTLTNDQIQMCIDFLTNVDFIPAA